MQRIRKGLFLLESAGSVNAYLIEGSHGLTLFDTGFPLCAALMAEELRFSGFALKDVEQIVLSHWHFDHAGGAHGLLGLHRVKVFAHPLDIPAIKGELQPPKRFFDRVLAVIAQRITYKPLEVVVPISQGETLRALPQWQVLHTPGHTPGSICLYQPGEKLLLCGDVLDNRSGTLALPFSSHNQDQARAVESARRLAELDCEVLGCGHGPVIRSAAALRIQELLATLG